LHEFYVRFCGKIGPIEVDISENPCNLEDNVSWYEENESNFFGNIYDYKWLAIIDRKIVAAADNAVLLHRMVGHLERKVPLLITYCSSTFYGCEDKSHVLITSL